MSVRIPLLLLCVLWALPACDGLPDYTGVWQQVCADEEDQTLCGRYALELHLGSYGDKMTGLVVRYLFTDAALDPFQRSNECGCWFIQGGRNQPKLSAFTLFEPHVARVPDERFAPAATCAERAQEIPAFCENALFRVHEEGDELVGELRCAGHTEPLRFVPSTGRPRRHCLSVPTP